MKKSEIVINIKLSTETKELGAFILRKAKEYQCSNSAVVRKTLQDAMVLEEKRQLKNMPIFNKT